LWRGGDRPEPVPDVRGGARRIVYVQYTNPGAYPPLEHSSRLLAAAGWDVLFLGTAVAGTQGMRLAPHPRIRVRQLPAPEAGWRGKLHYAFFVIWVVAWCLRWRPAWVYASDALACPAALMLSFRSGLKVVYHEHDAPSTRGGVAVSLKLWARRKVAQRAYARVAPSDQRANRFVRAVGNHQPTFSVWNCPRRDEVASPRDTSSGVELRLLYHGSIVPSRLPTSVLEALVDLADAVRLWVVGYETQGHRGYTRELRQLSETLGIAHRLRFVEEMPRADLLLVSRQADVGLAFVPSVSNDVNLREMAGASNKPFDYLAGGLALLVTDLPEWRSLYVEPGYGRACNVEDPASVSAAVRWFLEHPREMRAMGERGRRRVTQDWNYETQFAPVLACLNCR
jgi:glycosyltransferase involved in cell wall biosynthesis